MWTWIDAHKLQLQALGPLATIVAAIVAAGVAITLGIAQFVIAKSQRDIALDKLKSDIFKNRYEIYECCLSALTKMIVHMTFHPYDPLEWYALRLKVQMTEAFFPTSASEKARQLDDLMGDFHVALLQMDASEEKSELRGMAFNKLNKVRNETEVLLRELPSAFIKEMVIRHATRD